MSEPEEPVGNVPNTQTECLSVADKSSDGPSNDGGSPRSPGMWLPNGKWLDKGKKIPKKWIGKVVVPPPEEVPIEVPEAIDVEPEVISQPPVEPPPVPQTPLDESLERRFLYRQRIEKNGLIEQEKILCAESIVHWVSQWVFTYDPDEPVKNIPLDPWPKQIDLLEWFNRMQKERKRGLLEKGRRLGATYLACRKALHEWLFFPSTTIGFGSRMLEYVDDPGNPKCIFHKLRAILYDLPKWMLPKGFDVRKHDLVAKLLNPENESVIAGEGGDNIGRGARCVMYFIDEAAYLEHPELVEASLHRVGIRFDISTPQGLGNMFARMRHILPPDQVFRLHYSDDPRDTPEKIAKRKAETDPVIWAQEEEIDYTASIEGICIPGAWVRAAVDLLKPDEWYAKGPEQCGLDVAAKGKNVNVFTSRRGPITREPISWSKVGLTETAWKAKDHVIACGGACLNYDAGGLVDIIGTLGTQPFFVNPVNFGGTPTEALWPDGLNSQEKFLNLRAEMWYGLRCRFEKAWEFKEKGIDHPFEEMISIPNCPELITQLSTPLLQPTNTGKIKIESTEDMRKRGVKSPDYADSLALAFLDQPDRWGQPTGSNVNKSIMHTMPRGIVNENNRLEHGTEFKPADDSDEDETFSILRELERTEF